MKGHIVEPHNTTELDPGVAPATGAPQPSGTVTLTQGPTAAPSSVAALSWGNLPAPLRQRQQWLLAGPNAKGELKVPKTVSALTGWKPYAGSSTNAETWLDFETAVAAARHYGLGIGYVLHAADPFTCVDFDVKNVANEPDPAKHTTVEDLRCMQMMIEDLDSYTERSQSGQGFHVWVYAKFPGDGLKRKGVEVYQDARFIACTGNSIHDPAKSIEDRRDDIAQLVASMRGPDAMLAANMLLADVPTGETDDALLERARGYANAEKFNALWSGEWAAWIEPGMNGQPWQPYPSQSEADMALMGLLALYSKSNEQCRRLFLTSALGQRDKAQMRPKYLNDMLRKIRLRQAAQDARRIEQWLETKAIGEGTLPAAPMPTLTLDEMLNELVFIRRKSTVALRDKPTSFAPFADMRNDFAGSKSERIGPDGRVKANRTIDLWMESPKKLRADTLTFDPRYGEFCAAPDGLPALNLYRPRPHEAPADWEAQVQPFLDHVAYLVPDGAERERFLNWLAHIEQQPGELPHYGYIMVALKQGVGRNWLAAVLARLWRGHVALDFDLKQTLEKGFNGRLSRKFLVVVDEINEGKQADQWPHAEKLKSMVTATERYLNPKYGFEYAEHNCARWLLFSNHLSAIPLNDTDRRWQVVRNPDQPQATDYYANLYKLLGRPTFLAAVREWFQRRDLRAFNVGERPSMNEAKRAMIEVARSDAAEIADDLVHRWPSDVITAPTFGKLLYGDEQQKRSSQVKHRALEAGIVRWRGPSGKDARRLRVPGEQEAVRVWVLRNADRWAHADDGAIRDEIVRATNAAVVAGVARVLPLVKP